MIYNILVPKDRDEKEIGGLSDIPALTWPTTSVPEANRPLRRS
jgi:hypothetical protein